MSITINTEPNALHTAFNDVLWKVRSDRNNRDVLDISSVISVVGKTAYVTSTDPSLTTIQAGDVVTISGFDVSSNYYNSSQTVVSVTSSYIVTNLLYASAPTGTAIVTRTNNNFKIKSTVAVSNSPYYAATCSYTPGVPTYTSAAMIAAENIAVGDYVLHINMTNTLLNGLSKILSISGDTYVTDAAPTTTSSDSGKVMLLTISGILYGQSESIGTDQDFTFDIKNIINPYLSDDIISLGNTNIITTAVQGGIKTYAVRFEELYEDEDGLYAIPSDGRVDSSSKQMLNAVNQAYEAQTLTRYDMDGVSKEFLTEIPDNTLINIDQELQLSFITQELVVKVAYRKTDLSGVVGSWVNLTGVAMENADETYLRGVVPVSANTVFDSNTSIVEVRIEAVIGTDISETKTFRIDHRCYNDNVTLEFKNRQGGFDSYTYRATTTDNLDVKRQSSKNADIKSTSDVKSVRTLSLESRYENEDVFKWLEKLYESKEVYMVDSRYSTGRVKVNLLDTDYLINSQELFTSNIDIELQESLLN